MLQLEMEALVLALGEISGPHMMNIKLNVRAYV